MPTAQSPDEQSTERDALAAALLALGAATLGESGGRVMRPRIAAAWPGAALAAPAYAVLCTPGDNLAIHVGVTQAPAGSALVVDVGSAREFGYWGEVLTTAAQARGLSGLVIDGGVRDVAALEAHGFPVFSALVALQGATKQLPGAVGGAVDVGEAPVATGDWVVGDRDGVTVVPADRFDAVLSAGRERAARETRLFSELRADRTTVELLELDATRISIN